MISQKLQYEYSFPFQTNTFIRIHYINANIYSTINISSQKITSLENSYKLFLKYLLNDEDEKAVELVKESYLNGIPLPVIIEELLIPVLKEIGFLWEKGKITPAQEHYFSSIIEELIAFLGKSISIQEKKNFSVLLMVPGSEEHVITLKMASEYFRLKNWQVYYIGKNVPFEGLKKIIIDNNINVIVLSVTMDFNLNSCKDLITSINSLNISKKPLIIVGGNAVKTKEIAVSFLGANLFVPKVTDLNTTIDELEKKIYK